ncbi:efflux transporter outer membrane subunit [Asticcacaulis sp. AC402]|uniref:efflux transporter outer membrane subunit n=1 Tax=Asticcacaulis sp. AC402 TaxID=1282361 RepID=UPI0003C3CC02|nr:efflux transporter outer membrane subunit [Asticcacaulis sp. AC402]ESQ73638.1 multidrug transporter [Asticcacaulis sp. AC402]
MALLLPAIALSACTLAPKYEQPPLPVATQWSAPAPQASNAQVTWRDLFLDPQLKKTIDLALENNRDLRIAALNVQQARAVYGIERANLLPSADAFGSGTRSHTDVEGDRESYNANLGLAWELDLFGRIRSLKNAALQDFFASEANRDAVEISLIASVADAWLTLAADKDALRLSRETYASRQEDYRIAESRARIGVIGDLDLSQQKTQLEQARAEVAALETAVAQGTSVLTLLAGEAVPDRLLPRGLPDNALAEVPVGLPSEVLLARPDIMAAEHNLRAANADIGAARAAMFPSISLTGSTGFASNDLGSLFDAGNGKWSYGVGISMPVFAGGGPINALRGATARQEVAVAQYERAIQSAFNDVNQALAVRARIDERLEAQSAATAAAQRTFDLSSARYAAGSDSYLTLLDARRTLYVSQRSLIGLQYVRAANLVALYRALGNDASLKKRSMLLSAFKKPAQP